MIATVTLNPAVDKTMKVPGFVIGQTNRGRMERLDPGGKGINVAQAAKQLGCPVVASGFLAGNNGRLISEALAAQGIVADFVHVPGETRVNLKIIDPVTGTETEINEPGFPVGAADLKKLEGKIEQLAGQCAVMVFSGSLPPGAPEDIYAGFLRVAKDRGVKTILDTNGAALQYGMAVRPDLIKPNRAEVEELLQTRVQSEPQQVEAARRLLAAGPGTVVISLGADGALAASADRLVRARPPSVKTGTTTGAGDAMVAAFAWAMIRNLDLTEALRLAIAAGWATAADDGGRIANLRQIQDALPAVFLEELTLPAAVGCTPDLSGR